MKVKVKMPLSYYREITSFLADIATSGLSMPQRDIIHQQMLMTSLIELNRLLLNTVYLNSHYDSRKMITKSFHNSYALNFFGLFYGSNIDGYTKIPIKDMCRQIEEQLFIKGPYKLPSYVSTSQN